MRAWYVALALMAAPAAAFAQQATQAQAPVASSLTEIFEAANIAASRGDYAGAISNYGRLSDAGVRDADVYFNLATSFAQSGDYPYAILNYERTLTLRPGDAKATENLHDAEKALEEQRAEKEGEAMIQRNSSISDAVYGSLSEDALAIALIVANFLLFLALGAVVLSRERRGAFYGLLVCSAVVLVFGAIGLSAKAGLLRDGPRALALDDHVVLREGPDPRAKPRGEARGGDRGEIIDRDGDFVKLRVVGGVEGWAPRAGVGLIDVDHGVH